MVYKKLLVILILFLTIYINIQTSLFAEAVPPISDQNPTIASLVEISEKQLSLDWLITQGITNNPEIISLINDFESSKSRIKQAGALDDPILSFGIANFPLIDMSFRTVAMTQKRIELSQKFPFPGKRKLREEIAAKESESIEYMYFEKQREIIKDIKQAYYELSFIEESIDTTNKNKELIAQFIKITQIKYEVGKGTQQDILKSQIEYSKLNEELITLEKKKENLKSKIKNLAYIPQNLELGSTKRLELTDIALDKNVLIEESYQNRPLINQYQKLIDSYATRLELAKKAVLPDFKLSGAYGQRDNGFADLFSINLAFNLPIYKRRKQDLKVTEMDFKLLAVSAQLDGIKNDIAYEVNDQLINLDKEKRLLELLKYTIIPQTTQVLDSTIANYEVDRTDFLSVIDAQLMFYKYEIEYYRNLSNYYKDLANLENAVGKSLF